MIRFSPLFREILADVGVQAIASGVDCINTGFMLSVLLTHGCAAARWVVGLSCGTVESIQQVKAALITSQQTEVCDTAQDSSPLLSALMKECIDRAMAVAIELEQPSNSFV